MICWHLQNLYSTLALVILIYRPSIAEWRGVRKTFAEFWMCFSNAVHPARRNRGHSKGGSGRVERWGPLRSPLCAISRYELVELSLVDNPGDPPPFLRPECEALATSFSPA